MPVYIYIYNVEKGTLGGTASLSLATAQAARTNAFQSATVVTRVAQFLATVIAITRRDRQNLVWTSRVKGADPESFGFCGCS